MKEQHPTPYLTDNRLECVISQVKLCVKTFCKVLGQFPKNFLKKLRNLGFVQEHLSSHI